MKIIRFALLAIVVFVAGCARVNTTTTLRADGSFTRKVVYTVSKNGMGPSGDDSQQKPEKPEDYFKIPAASPNLSVTRADGANGQTVTVSREVPASAGTLEDISLLNEAGKVMATSSATVKKLPDGKLEYVETLHSVTPGKAADQLIAPDLRARVKKLLPEEFQNTETIDLTTKAVMTNVARVLVGPPDPIFFTLLTATDSALRKLNAAVYFLNVKSFKEIIPSITDEQARTMAKSLANAFNQDILNPAKSAPQPGSEGNTDKNAMSALFFSVSFPGKIVETDGIVDPVEGDVYWSLFPMALDLGDVKLRVVVQP